jgi:hypothetical protein
VPAGSLAIPVEWNVFAVGPREVSLSLIEIYGACGSVDPTVRETRTSVAIEIVEASRPGPCIALAREQTLELQLAHPLAGRTIQGLSSEGLSLRPVFGARLTVTPRLIGFAPQDAVHALALFSLRRHTRVVRATRGLRRVVAQYPAPGRPAPRSGVVRLAVGGR